MPEYSNARRSCLITFMLTLVSLQHAQSAKEKTDLEASEISQTPSGGTCSPICQEQIVSKLSEVTCALDKYEALVQSRVNDLGVDLDDVESKMDLRFGGLNAKVDHVSGDLESVNTSVQTAITLVQEVNRKITNTFHSSTATDSTRDLQSAKCPSFNDTQILAILTQMQHSNGRIESDLGQIQRMNEEVLLYISEIRSILEALLQSNAGITSQLQDITRTNRQIQSTLANTQATESDRYESLLANQNSLMNVVNATHAIISSANQDKRPQDCADIQKQGSRRSGVYTIYPKYRSSRVVKRVYCDLQTNGGNWLVFQKRLDGSVDFERNWEDYKKGFGSADGEYWLGNRYINLITSQRPYELRIDMWDFESRTAYATYDLFVMGNEEENFVTHFGRYGGNAGAGLDALGDVYFSTFDRDNDVYGGNCASRFNGGWWYKECHGGCLNCLYLRGNHSSRANGVNWYHWKGEHYSLRKAEMKIRPIHA